MLDGTDRVGGGEPRDEDVGSLEGPMQSGDDGDTEFTIEKRSITETHEGRVDRGASVGLPTRPAARATAMGKRGPMQTAPGSAEKPR